MALAFAILKTQSRGDIRDPASFEIGGLRASHWITRRVPRLALRAIGCADVRSGILPSQSGLRGNDRGSVGLGAMPDVTTQIRGTPCIARAVFWNSAHF
jgi:hypothetical protein